MAIDIYGIGLSDILAIAALAISTSLFYVGHTRNKKSEQIRLSRDIWERIDAQLKIIAKWSDMDDASRVREHQTINEAVAFLIIELEYFVYLAETGEIREKVIREYYSTRLAKIIYLVGFIDKKQHDFIQFKIAGNLFPGPGQNILDVIEPYFKIIGKMDKYMEYRRDFTAE